MTKKVGREAMTKNVTVRMGDDLYERLTVLAEKDRRRVGEYVRLALEDMIPRLEQDAHESTTSDE